MFLCHSSPHSFFTSPATFGLYSYFLYSKNMILESRSGVSRKAEKSLDTLGSTATLVILVVIPLSTVVAWSSLGCLRCSAFRIDAPFQRQRNVFVANHRNENGSALSILGIFLLSTQAGTRRHMVNICEYCA